MHKHRSGDILEMILAGNKKNLLVLYGEYRTFPVIPKQLKDLDTVDIIFSTWSETSCDGKSISINETDINSILESLPNLKLIVNEYKFGQKYNSWKMYYHWYTAINSVDDESLYDKVLLHRCDMISNWEIIQQEKWENDTLYISSGDNFELNKFWVGDYYIGGNFNTIKKFVNLFKNNNDEISHIPIGNVIIQNNFKVGQLKLNSWIIRKCHENFINSLNNNNIIFLEQPLDGPLFKKFVEIQNTANPNYPIQLESLH